MLLEQKVNFDDRNELFRCVVELYKCSMMICQNLLNTTVKKLTSSPIQICPLLVFKVLSPLLENPVEHA